MSRFTDSGAPPQAPDIERAVLGAMLLDKRAVESAVSLITEAAFYRPDLGIMFKAMRLMFEQDRPVDQLTLTEQLKSMGSLEEAGGERAIASLAAATRSTANVKFHCGELREYQRRRSLISLSAVIRSNALDATRETGQTLELLQEQINSLVDHDGRTGYVAAGDAVVDAYNLLAHKASLPPGEVYGIPIGYRKLDSLFDGFQEEDLIVLAARPSLGKTALALNIARNVANAGVPTAVFSLEMSTTQLMMRMLSSESGRGTNADSYRNYGDGDWDALSKAMERITDMPLYIKDTPGMTLSQFVSTLGQMIREKGVKFVVIDYLQLMQGDGSRSRNDEIGAISRGLKIAAKRYKIPILVLSQLSRDMEKLQRRPRMSDLRDSGAIEQDADTVAFIYDAPDKEKDDPNNAGYDRLHGDKTDVREIIVKKNRNGPTCTVYLKFRKDHSRFYDIDY